MKTRYPDIPAYVTKDGQEIRELLHPDLHGSRNLSLAEAVVPAGTRTLLHRHRLTEEIYHVTSGRGWMRLGDERLTVESGDTVLIAPGTPHCIEAVDNASLHILCCCSPAYTLEDTELLEEG